jgi:hypothetical protein
MILFLIENAFTLYALMALLTLFTLIGIWKRDHFGALHGIEDEMRLIIALSFFWSFVFSMWFLNWFFALPVFTWGFWLREIKLPHGRLLSGWWHRR